MSVAKHVVSRPVLVAVVFALLAIVGLYTLTDLAIELFPETSMPMLFVSTTYEGAGPETVEKSVTRVLEGVLTNLSGLKKMTSTSSEGSSRIELEFDYGTNLDTAVNDIRDKLDRVKNSLPDDASTPQIFRFDPNSMPIMRIAVRGNRSAEQLKAYAEDYIQPRLEQVNGVAQANVQGGRDKIIKVELSQNRLDAYGLTVTGVASVLATQNVELGGGSITEAVSYTHL
ncbi:MAG: efflux RND transporter permease subunit, partial [Thermanaerothrix sp.]|nr:efflux RND transporter permease subunit [Thermanaerothrix sp.]